MSFLDELDEDDNIPQLDEDNPYDVATTTPATSNVSENQEYDEFGNPITLPPLLNDPQPWYGTDNKIHQSPGPESVTAPVVETPRPPDEKATDQKNTTQKTKSENILLPGLKSQIVRDYIIKQARDNPNYNRQSLVSGIPEQDRDSVAREIHENDRSKLVQDVQDADSSPWANIFAGLAGFGAGVRHGDVGAAYKQAIDGSTAQQKFALEQFDKNTDEQAKQKELDLRVSAGDRAAQKDLREQQLFRNNNDPNSNKSKAYRESLIKSLKITDPDVLSGLEGKSYSDLEKIFPVLSKQFDNAWDQKKQDDGYHRHQEDLAQRREDSSARLALAGANLNMSGAQLKLAMESGKRADEAAQRAAEAAAGNVDIIETSRGKINYKEPKEQEKLSQVRSADDLKKRYDSLVRDGTVAANVGLLDEAYAEGTDLFKSLSARQQDFIRWRTDAKKYSIAAQKSEPNSQGLQNEIYDALTPKNDAGIAGVSSYLGNEIDKIDPSGLYREGNQVLKQRNKQGTPLPTPGQLRPATSKKSSDKIPEGATGTAKDGTPVVRKNGKWVPR